MLRPVLLLVALLLAACGRGADATDALVDTEEEVSATAGVRCPDIFSDAPPLVCEGDLPVCCLKGKLLRPACVATLAACGADNQLACDDALDCGDGRSCCRLEYNDGSPKFRATCKDRCSLLERPTCAGPGTCASGQRCCIEAGDLWGACVPEGRPCPEPEEEQGR